MTTITTKSEEEESQPELPLNNSNMELFTSGEWRPFLSEMGELFVDACEGNKITPIAKICLLPNLQELKGISEEQMANAVLFAAAKKLFHALLGCIFALDENAEGAGPTKQQALEQAQSVIAMATGRAE